MLSIEIGLDEITRARDLFLRFPERLRANLRVAGVESSVDLLKEISAGLQGARGGPNRITGALLRSWHVLPVRDTETGIESGAGSNKEYARYQDQGFHGAENVRAFTRKVTTGNAYGSLEGRRKKLVAQGIAFVHPFTRMVNYAGKPYVSPAIEAARDSIRARHVAAIERTASEAG